MECRLFRRRSDRMETTLLYRASRHDCDACELKLRCCPKMPARKVPRSIYEHARDVARDIAKTETYVTSRRERKKIEMLFAHLKRILRLDADIEHLVQVLADIWVEVGLAKAASNLLIVAPTARRILSPMPQKDFGVPNERASIWVPRLMPSEYTNTRCKHDKSKCRARRAF
jgi:hypothetical protein